MKKYSDVKIGCYAISAGEPEEFIDRWLDSMSGADYIYVLITREHDSNYRYFQKKREEERFKDKLVVAEKEIKPWRFDVARNESLRLIPEGDFLDVLVCTDIDEILIPDFWDDLRKVVADHPDFYKIGYKYAWNHDDQGNPGRVFWYDKIHQAKGWRWKYPVHEALHCDDPEALGFHDTYFLDENKIYLHHYPDNTKSRGSYLGLLEQRVQEDDSDTQGLYYLMREYQFKGMYEKAVDTGMRLYRIAKTTPLPEYIPNLADELGNDFGILKMDEEAEFFYTTSLKYDPTWRNTYIDYGQFLAWRGRFEDALKILEEADEKSVRRYDWREIDYNWTWRPLQVKADAYCWAGKYDEALKIFEEAETMITTSKDAVEAVGNNFYADEAWLHMKIANIDDLQSSVE